MPIGTFRFLLMILLVIGDSRLRCRKCSPGSKYLERINRKQIKTGRHVTFFFCWGAQLREGRLPGQYSLQDYYSIFLRFPAKHFAL